MKVYFQLVKDKSAIMHFKRVDSIAFGSQVVINEGHNWATQDFELVSEATKSSARPTIAASFALSDLFSSYF